MQKLTQEQQDKLETLEKLSAAFLSLLQAEEAEADDEAAEAMNSLATSEEDLDNKAAELTEMNNCLKQSRFRMQEALMWAARAVKRDAGVF